MVIMKKNERKILKKLYKSNKFCDILQIHRGTVAVIGSGGKTSLIGRLCTELSDSGRVIFTTTTHIMRPADMAVACSLGDLDSLLGASVNPICIGSVMPDNPKKMSSPNVSIEALELRTDYVLVEADGSKMLPVKAHKSYEPVIPKNSNRVIIVVGLSGIGMRVCEGVHRVDEFMRLTGAVPDDILSAEMIAKGIAAEVENYSGFGLTLYINQTDIENGEIKAGKFAAAFRGFLTGRNVEVSIFAGSLKEGYIYSL